MVNMCFRRRITKDLEDHVLTLILLIVTNRHRGPLDWRDAKSELAKDLRQKRVDSCVLSRSIPPPLFYVSARLRVQLKVLLDPTLLHGHHS